MEQKEIKIKIPSGMEIDKENSSFECIKFRPIEKKLPETWEEFCKTHPWKSGESWINNACEIRTIRKGENLSRNAAEDKNLLPNKELAEAMLALCQLIQLRDCYNDGWVPDWNNQTYKYRIEVVQYHICSIAYTGTHAVLAFKTEKLCDEFLSNFKDLLEIAKPLL